MQLRSSSKIAKYIMVALVTAAGIVTITALVSIRSWYKPTIKQGLPSPVTVVLNQDVEVLDKLATEEARSKAKTTALKKSAKHEILTVDYEAFNHSLKKLKFIIHAVREHRSAEEIMPDPLNPKVSLKTQQALIKLDDEKFNQILLSTDLAELVEDRERLAELNSMTEIERKIFFEGLNGQRELRQRKQEVINSLGKSFFDNLAKVNAESLFANAFTVQKKLLDLGLVRGMPRNKIRSNIKILFPGLLNGELELIHKLVINSTDPNLEIDWTKLRQLEQEAMDQVEPVTVELKQGALLASKGKVVSKQNYFYLKELEMLNPQTDWKEIYENFTIITALILFITLFNIITKFRQYSVQQIVMMFTVPITTFMVIDAISIWGVDKLALAPLAAVSILLTVFYAPTMAAIVVLLMAFFMAKAVDMNFWQVLPHLVGSIYAIFLVRKAHQREDLTNAGTKIAIAQVLVFLLTLTLAVEDFDVAVVMVVAACYVVSAIGSGFISLAALPYLEAGLKLYTPFKLAELSNPNQPLLKKLKEEAPGTYEHSLNVSRLSEEAGNALGLNTELIRVGLLYHDIGKMHAPDYFIENTLGKPNPHTTLDDPKKSAEIILAHVPEGIRLAKKYNLPQAIIDFIPMHQGTTITTYFYQQAVEKLGKRSVRSADFRYPGPRPNTKETGIAMIADSSEAALRSIKDIANESEARKMIRKIINARMEEGELDDSGLTRSDLDKVSAAFFNIWKSQNHERVKYPEKEKDPA